MTAPLDRRPQQAPPFEPMSLEERISWINAEPMELHRRLRRYFLLAQTAMGNGTIEEQMLRLMVWVGTLLPSTNPSTGFKTPLAILASGTAWCEQQCRTFAYMALHIRDVDVRGLSVLHCDGVNSHSVIEVYYNNAWHLFDVHSEHQAVYRHPREGHIMCYEEVAAHSEVVEQEGHWWKGKNGVGKVGFYARGGKLDTRLTVERDFWENWMVP